MKSFIEASTLFFLLIKGHMAETLFAGKPLLEETPSDKKQILEKHKIVPDVFSHMPKHVMFGHFEGKEMSFGNSFTPDEIKKKPDYLDWPTNGTKALYCLLAIGIDVPSKKEPKLRDFRHWLVGNIPSTDIERGQEIIPYLGAGNFLDEGSHRILFVVFQQPYRRKLKFYERNFTRREPIARARGNTSTLKFAEKYGLNEPVAANFLTVETDVPKSTPDYYAHMTTGVPPD
nr:PREDICTED: protein D3-like [Bemisia tabaci]